ncbi:hypothetical protein EUGRSUZ_G03099 [Eucalyptus grandis]|uniref:Uncharacterized protein n=2 Tax=Eucalyptus grandis TaxID=71139 RepID=A0ACC3K8F5_EUCGR|nr:hypothetical protein EUGRSUZ_G03099 [Eucalyptus grandis]
MKTGGRSEDGHQREIVCIISPNRSKPNSPPAHSHLRSSPPIPSSSPDRSLRRRRRRRRRQLSPGCHGVFCRSAILPLFFWCPITCEVFAREDWTGRYASLQEGQFKQHFNGCRMVGTFSFLPKRRAWPKFHA